VIIVSFSTYGMTLYAQVWLNFIKCLVIAEIDKNSCLCRLYRAAGEVNTTEATMETVSFCKESRRELVSCV